MASPVESSIFESMTSRDVHEYNPRQQGQGSRAPTQLAFSTGAVRTAHALPEPSTQAFQSSAGSQSGDSRSQKRTRAPTASEESPFAKRQYSGHKPCHDWQWIYQPGHRVTPMTHMDAINAMENTQRDFRDNMSTVQELTTRMKATDMLMQHLLERLNSSEHRIRKLEDTISAQANATVHWVGSLENRVNDLEQRVGGLENESVSHWWEGTHPTASSSFWPLDGSDLEHVNGEVGNA